MDIAEEARLVLSWEVETAQDSYEILALYAWQIGDRIRLII